MSVRKIDGAWYVDVRWRGRRYRRKSQDDSRTGAQAYELHLRRELEVKGFLPVEARETPDRTPVGDGTLVAFAHEWFSTYVRNNLRSSTCHGYSVALRRHLLPVLGHLPLQAIGPREIESFKAAKRGTGLHPKTVNGCLSVLRSCLTYAADSGRIDDIPRFRWLKVPPARFDHLSPSESRRLMQAAAERPYRLMIHVALRTGMRLGELLALKWECVDLERRLLLVRSTRTRGEGRDAVENAPKNNRDRYIPLAMDLCEAFSATSQGKGYVFADLFGRPLTHDSATRGLRRALRAAGLRRIGWHALRHSFATQLVSEGAPLHGVQAFMGHATLEMTLRYSHFAPTAFRRSVDLLAAAEEREASPVGSGLGSGVNSETDQARSPRLEYVER